MRGIGFLSCALLCLHEGVAFQARPVPLLTKSRIRPSRPQPAFQRIQDERNIGATSSTSLSVIPALATALASPVGAISVVLSLILVHEGGHYTAAKIFGMKVDDFSIGFGPKVLGFEAFGNNFTLRALPLGGYVQFPPDCDEQQIRNVEKRQFLEDAKEQPPAQRKLLNALTFGTYEKSVERLVSEIQKQDRAAEVPFWEAVFGSKAPTIATTEEDIEYYDDPDLLQNRPWPQRVVVLAGGIAFNILLAFSIFFGQITGDGVPKPVFGPGAVVSQVVSSDVPAAGVLEKGDVITAINGSPLSTASRIGIPQSSQIVSDFISRIRETDEGESLDLSVLRPQPEGKIEELDVVVEPKFNKDVGAPSIGVALAPYFLQLDLIKSDKLLEAVVLAAKSVADLTADTVDGIFQVLGSMVFGNSMPMGASVSGPVGLIKSGGEVVKMGNIGAVLAFAAALSVNLAVVNAFPLPALDGGQLAFVLYEAATGKKVDRKVQEGLTSAAVTLLLALTISTTVNDVVKLFQ